jgi:hypothetical protein
MTDATTMNQQVQRKYDIKLDPLTTSPPKNYNDARNRELQWFEAEAKERDGMLRFNTWTRIPQNQITPIIRRYALRAHHIYSLKRDGTAKNRVVVNGRRQHESTYSDTTSPVATQLLTRLILAIAAYRCYSIAQMDLTNAYLHANIKDKICIIIPAGFPGEGEVARLDKATYGTKQGARRFYDHTLQVLTTIGMTQSLIEPCLFRMLFQGKEAFLILYVDDALIVGQPTIVTHIKQQLQKHFDCKFNIPKDFLGMDINQQVNGTISLSMKSFTEKLQATLNITDDEPSSILMPGRTDKKIIRDEDIINDPTYRSKVSSIMWLTLCLRYDLIYTVKELSRVLQQPTALAQEILKRTLLYICRTKHYQLTYDPTAMAHHQPPPVRPRPHTTKDIYATEDCNTPDAFSHLDDKAPTQDYIYPGPPVVITCMTDIDLAGQIESRQSTSGYLLFINGVLVHFHGRTERLVLSVTAAGEYVALSRGNTACKFVREVLTFLGNPRNPYHLYSDNQACEDITTKPTMTEHSRTIDIRHHGVRQDYINKDAKVGGIKSKDNHSDILTERLPPQLNAIHTQFLQPPEARPTQQIFTNNGVTFSYSSSPRGTGHGSPMHTATEVDNHKRGDQRSTALRTRPNPRFNGHAFGAFLREHLDLDNNIGRSHQTKTNSQHPPRPPPPYHRTPIYSTHTYSPLTHNTNNLSLSHHIPSHNHIRFNLSRFHPPPLTKPPHLTTSTTTSNTFQHTHNIQVTLNHTITTQIAEIAELNKSVLQIIQNHLHTTKSP